MKRLLCVVFCLLLMAAPAFAQPEKGQPEVRIGGGVSLPMGDFGDYAKTGFMFGGEYGIYLSPQFQLGGQIYYHLFGIEDEYSAGYSDKQAATSVDANLDFNILEFGAFGKYLFSPKFSTPYLKGGIGFFNSKLSGDVSGPDPLNPGETLTINVDESGTDIGFVFGAGFQSKGEGTTGFFLEGTYNSISTEGSSSNFVNLRGGVAFYFGLY